MGDAKIRQGESREGRGKIAEGKIVSGKSVLGKSFPAKSFPEKSFSAKSSWENQFDKIDSEEINSGKITSAESSEEPSIWLYTLSEETRKLLVHDGVSKLHYIWAAMKQRCYNPKSRNYQWYGARGIKVCKSWLRWQNFKPWALRNGYDPDAPYGECTLDRIDVDGDYQPSNCRWVSFKEQMNNRQSNKNASKAAPVDGGGEDGEDAIIAMDGEGNIVYEFDGVSKAASFFRPNNVESAKSYIKRALRRGDTSYKLYWSYR